MRVLTVQQPWAWAIVHGGKDIENRTQEWSYRGPLAIHAGARISDRGLETVPEIVAAERGTSPTLVADAMHHALATRAIVGVVDLVDAHVAEEGCCESWWAESSYAEHGGRTRRDFVHLVLENPSALATPIPATGRLGLWHPGADLEAAIREQMPS